MRREGPLSDSARSPRALDWALTSAAQEGTILGPTLGCWKCFWEGKGTGQCSFLFIQDGLENFDEYYIQARALRPDGEEPGKAGKIK